MARLKIQHLGPINEGYQGGDGLLDFDGLTVFIGKQGSGKSTAAKVYSTMSWIEKALVRGDFTATYIAKYSRFKQQLAYQNIRNYLRPESLIEYVGAAYSITFEKGQLRISQNKDGLEYHFPKIMYVPAERNFVSSVDRPDLVKRLPLPLYTFLDEYDAARQNLQGKIDLPIGNVKFEYRSQNKKSWLIGENYKINLLEASSGFQSLVPLLLVSNYLAGLTRQNGHSSHKSISVEEEKKIREEVEKIYANENISEDVRKVLLEKLSARFKYASFLNIVEEPEQNLYPNSQKNILFELIRYKNESRQNQLVLTTHSPYIINYLTLAIKAHELIGRLGGKEPRSLQDRLAKIIPLKSAIDPTQVNIYQIDGQGAIQKLPDFNGIPSDSNFLNQFLAETNDSFDALLDIEEDL